MPSRKRDSSETQPESRRSSLRRLSSIASLQTLFARRRGNAGSSAPSSSSTLSLSRTCVPRDASGPSTAASTDFEHPDPITVLPQSAAASRPSSKRSSYVCLPDDPIGGMPRSRTFSNLPVPVKARKASSLSQSQSHARLPSFAPSTRLPSPPSSTRRHSHSRLASVDSKVPVLTNRAKRSGTEPLLLPPAEQSPSFGRSTAVKENITLSPIKPLPALDMSSTSGAHGDAHFLQPRARRPSLRAPTEARTNPTTSAFGYENPYASHPAVQIARGNKSSPTYKSGPHGELMPIVSIPQPVQRWNSQPVLTNITNNNRSSLQGETRQTRLLSARQAPTPPPPKTPLAWEGHAGRAKSSSVSSSILLQAPESLRNLPHSAIKSSPTLPKPSSLSVSCAEPTTYWAGRLCALTDRFRNEELATQLISASSYSHFRSGLTPKQQTDKMHTIEASIARNKRALNHLNELCITLEARESLLHFQAIYAKDTGQPDLAPPKQPTRTILLGPVKNEVAGAGNGTDLISENRKASFMDRLLGRQKRHSLVLG